MPSREELMIGEVREPRLIQRVKEDPHTGQVLREWSEWVLPDGRIERHGIERQYHPDGAPHWVRHFDHGKPVGHWRGWYPDGSRLAESFHGTDETKPMVFWHPNGVESARGMAIDGRRVGVWKHWYSDGSLREEGSYRGGRRVGVWTYYHDDGSLEARGTLEDGMRVGEWELYEPGVRFVERNGRDD